MRLDGNIPLRHKLWDDCRWLDYRHHRHYPSPCAWSLGVVVLLWCAGVSQFSSMIRAKASDVLQSDSRSHLTISLFALEAEHFAPSECHYLLSKLIGSTQVVVIPWRSLSSCLNSKDRNLMNRHCSSFRWPSHTPVPWNHAIHKIARVDTVSTIPSRSDAIVEAWCTTVVCQWWILYGAVSSRMLVQNRPRQVTLRYDWCKIIN